MTWKINNFFAFYNYEMTSPSKKFSPVSRRVHQYGGVCCHTHPRSNRTAMRAATRIPVVTT